MLTQLKLFPRFLILLSAIMFCAGCGISQNPSYFPHWVPFGDIIRTHGKPIGPSYYSNFDPYACRLEVRPIESSNPVATQHVIIATVYDSNGKPRRGRRVEWMLEGVGHIVEVDESGFAAGRGYKVDNRYAVSYTEYKTHTFTRGNNDPNDDFTIRPGQSWCVITSPVEGDSIVTVYAPGIYNWDQHKVNVTKHWVNAGWTLPPPAVNPIGTDHVFTTNVFRITDKAPVANYRVRYTILDGPPASFLPNNQQVAEAVTDFQGNANVTLVQQQPAAGINRIGVEIIRPPDTTTGVGITVGRGETSKEWIAPNIEINKSGPPNVPVGQPFDYTITVTNTGRVATEGVTVRDVPPDGLRFQSSQPPANREGRELIWTIGGLAAGESANIRATFQAERVGSVTNCAVATTPEGLRAEHCTTTQVTAPQLSVRKNGPSTALVGQPVNYQIIISNPGSGPANNVTIIDQFDPGLEHSTRTNPIQLDIGTIAPGENRTVELTLTGVQPGQFVNRVQVTGDGGLVANAEHAIRISEPKLSILKSGPRFRYTGQTVEFDIIVANTGEVPLENVVIRDRLPPELRFEQASAGGQLQGNEVVWNLGTLTRGQQRPVQLVARAERVSDRVVNTAVVTAAPGLEERADAAVEIRGVPALNLEVVDRDDQDPVAIGGRTTYDIRVRNPGSLPASGIEIIAILPPKMRAVDAVGPTGVRPRIDSPDGRIDFPPIDGLQPGQELLYTVTGEAVSAGDVRFRVELRSTGSLGAEPVIEEEPTIIYNPRFDNGP